ncbi:hypothetical protein Bca4012_011078 [Brassica carinata]
MEIDVEPIESLQGFDEGDSGSSSVVSVFDQLPMDILVQIMMLMEPRDAVKLSLTCKALKRLVGCNRIWIFYLQCLQESWDSIFFAETSLRCGYPLRMVSSESEELSFMRVYGQRAQVPDSIIIDGGSGFCKFGRSKNDSPSRRVTIFREFGRIESPIYARLQQFFETIFNRMQQVKPSMQPIVVSLPLCHHDDTESAKADHQGGNLRLLSLIAVFFSAVLALYAARQTSGIVVNIGFQVITVVPILHGKVMRQCYVALDYEAELSRDAQASMEIAGTLSKQHFFQTGEILFQPRLAGINFYCFPRYSYISLNYIIVFAVSCMHLRPGRAMGLQQAVALCMDHCDAAGLTGDGSWFKTVVLAGGSACLPGLAERLEKELHDYLPSSICNGVRVIPPPYGVDTVWHGAKLISNLSTFPGPWCITRKQLPRKSRLMCRSCCLASQD